MAAPETIHQEKICDEHDTIVCDGYLWSFLQGELDPAEALLVDIQCQLSAEARNRLRALTMCAAAAMETLPPQTMRCSAQAFFAEKCSDRKTDSRNDDDKDGTRHCECAVQRCLQRHTGCVPDQLHWRTVHPGVQEARLKIAGSRLEARLLKIRQDGTLPLHAQDGDEMVLVLEGALHDAARDYAAGDFRLNKKGRNAEALPVALSDSLCLTVFRGPIRLHGLLDRILRPFLREG